MPEQRPDPTRPVEPVGSGPDVARSGTAADTLRYAASRALLAPSVHNSQPWRFVLTDDSLEIYADSSRQLSVLDPFGRQLMISCGCALFNARAAVAASGYEPAVQRLPGTGTDPVARIRLSRRQTGWQPLGVLDRYAVRRRSNRSAYLEEVVPPPVIDDLCRSAMAEGVRLTEIRHHEQRRAAEELSRRAAVLEEAEPAYREELRRWTTDDPTRPDGVVAARTAARGDADDMTGPVSDYRLVPPVSTGPRADPCLLVLACAEDTAAAWLRAGEALERAWLEATQLGYVASVFSQVIEIPRTREELRAALRLAEHPQLILRVGRAEAGPASNRRPLAEVLTEQGRRLPTQ